MIPLREPGLTHSNRMATKEAKPDGQFWLPPEMAMRHMGPLPVQVSLVVLLVFCLCLVGPSKVLRDTAVMAENNRSCRRAICFQR